MNAGDGSTLTWRVMGLELAVGEPDTVLRARAAETLGVEPERLRGFRLAKKSLDARRRGAARSLRFHVQADVVLGAGETTPALERAVRAGRVVRAPRPGRLEVDTVHPSLAGRRVVVVGSGPAGLFAALVLARSGVPATLLDRGASLRERGRALGRFDRTRVPDPETNLLFGEGGAGTYSDGKLYTRIEDPLEAPILETLVACGAPAEIAYDARAHIGTDRLHRVLPRLRASMEAAGVSFAWNARLDGLVAGEGPLRRVRALRTTAGELPCDALLLAPGHSARDTFAKLAAQGVAFEAKPFQLGVRIEHPQPLIDRARHGAGPEAALLGAASYNLVCRAEAGVPASYSFCMCPGGKIVASVNEPGLLCTNGMSNSRHSSPFANAAIVTTFGPREFGPGAFAGVAFQREIEARFFAEGGGDYTAPAQRADDFLAGRESKGAPPTSYRFGTRPARIDRLVPPLAREAIRRALARFERQIPGFAGPDGILVGIESRSSAPVRMPRDPESRRAAGFANLYPMGEGAGWAGGIMSAALDGARTAQALLRHGLE